MNKRLRTILLTICCMMLSVMMCSMPAQAASSKQKAVKAYKNFLSQSTVMLIPKGTRDNKVRYWDPPHYYVGNRPEELTFATAYINKDNIPELIVTASSPVYMTVIFTYRKGKVVRVADSISSGSFLSYYKKSNVMVFRHSTEGTLYYAEYKNMSGKSLGGGFINPDEPKENYYYTGRKRVPKKQLFSKLKIGSKKPIDPKLIQNTPENRNLYIK